MDFESITIVGLNEHKKRLMSIEGFSLLFNTDLPHLGLLACNFWMPIHVSMQSIDVDVFADDVDRNCEGPLAPEMSS